MAPEVQQMKWYGWGLEGKEFDLSDKPELWPYIVRTLQMEEYGVTPPVPLESIELPPLKTNDACLGAVRGALREDQYTATHLERVVHAYGKSFRDLWRIRQGIIQAAPDLVVYPESEADIVALVKAASEHGVALVPFGGGSNIVGSLEAHDAAGRMVVSLDLKRMNRVLSVDTHSCAAVIQPGVLGPDMEDQLNAQGVTLGHFPDSFEFSTLGGWVATRSAGMQSDKYGKIEDMVLALRMVTPNGTIVSRTVPRCSNGISMNHLCIGSEGILGVISEVTMQVHLLPEERRIYGYLFPSFEQGVEAIHTCVRQGLSPVITRLNDAPRTALSLAFKSKSAGLQHLLTQAVKAYLRHGKRFDFDKCCLLLAGFEGTPRQVREDHHRVHKVYAQYGGFNLGTAPGRAFTRGKYDFPYMRDYAMDRGVMADVSETATTWSNLLPLYYSVSEALNKAVAETGSPPFTGCHISHTYHSGASLYFTFGFVQNPELGLSQYLRIKKAAEDAFLRGGATLSHHHAVGIEHLPWVEDDISPTGVLALRALKEGLDPNAVMNPGKLIPSSAPLEAWGLTEAREEFAHSTSA